MYPEQEAPSSGGRRRSLRADCASCFGLCCAALPFTASADFAFDKEAGEPCANLQSDFHCGIHARLREEGFAGCTAFDCFGAGQKVSRTTFGGQDWRQAPHTARQMFDAFSVMRRLHELLWYLTEALSMPHTGPIHHDLRDALSRIDDLTDGTARAVVAVDVAALRDEIRPLLRRTSELARAGVPGPKRDLRGADLVAAELGGADLRGADLGGAYLIAAQLTNADLRGADLIGADLRGADLSGADLGGCFFLTQPQLDAAKGDLATTLPVSLDRPPHWQQRGSG